MRTPLRAEGSTVDAAASKQCNRFDFINSFSSPRSIDNSLELATNHREQASVTSIAKSAATYPPVECMVYHVSSTQYNNSIVWTIKYTSMKLPRRSTTRSTTSSMDAVEIAPDWIDAAQWTRSSWLSIPTRSWRKVYTSSSNPSRPPRRKRASTSSGRLVVPIIQQ